MKKKNQRIKYLLVISFVLAIFTVQVACSDSTVTSDEENISLSYAFFAPDNTFPAIQMKKWVEELEKRTEGKVEVDLFFGGSLLGAENMFDGVKEGTADIGLTATTYEPGRFPLLEISDLPSGYPNSEIASQVVSDLIKEYPPDALSDFKIITSFATEPSFIQSVDPISNLEDLANKQLRISGGLVPAMKALGAAPVGMSQAEVPEALQTNIIEGNVSSREVLKDLKLAETVKYVTDYPLTITTFVAVMNKDKWNSLPDDVKTVIDELNSEMSLFTGKYLDEHVQESLKWSEQEEGLEVILLSENEKKRWDNELSAIQAEAVNKANSKGLPGTEYQERLYELLEQYNQ